MASSDTKLENLYLNWIHCNRCYEVFMKKERTFFLLACQHVICQVCQIEIQQTINGPQIYKCPVCQKVTRASEINNTMPKNLKELFHPEPYLDGLNSFLILNFQAGHRRRNLQHLDRQANLIQEMDKVTEKYKESCKKIFNELYQAKSERKQMAKRLLCIQQQTREIESNGHTKSPSLSSSSSSAKTSYKTRKMKTGLGQKNDGITSFAQLTPKNSFLF